MLSKNKEGELALVMKQWKRELGQASAQRRLNRCEAQKLSTGPWPRPHEECARVKGCRVCCIRKGW